MEKPRKRMGRPPKPPGEVLVNRMMRWPPALWEELEELVPERQRSAFIRRAVERALASERRRQAKAAEVPEQ
jgi:hypothetical protein